VVVVVVVGRGQVPLLHDKASRCSGMSNVKCQITTVMEIAQSAQCVE
jgi:hypothetical protein